ncbi:hypothetical protein CMI37_34230 [Candidatus Pacearchaeota archaeon]|nr:hypothetical protein [Candidatus Pacearchaeota archaeon]
MTKHTLFGHVAAVLWGLASSIPYWLFAYCIVVLGMRINELERRADHLEKSVQVETSAGRSSGEETLVSTRGTSPWGCVE